MKVAQEPGSISGHLPLHRGDVRAGVVYLCRNDTDDWINLAETLTSRACRPFAQDMSTINHANREC
jgi:hypothetical protein